MVGRKTVVLNQCITLKTQAQKRELTHSKILTPEMQIRNEKNLLFDHLLNKIIFLLPNNNSNNKNIHTHTQTHTHTSPSKIFDPGI